MNVQCLRVVLALYILDLNLQVRLEGLVLAEARDARKSTKRLRCHMLRFFATLAHQFKEVLGFVPHVIVFHAWLGQKLLECVVEFIAIGRCIGHDSHRVAYHFGFYIAVQFLQDSIWLLTRLQISFLLEEHIEARVGVDFHEPCVVFFVNQDVHAQNLEALRLFVVL